MDKPSLQTSSSDIVASALRGLLGACPGIGSALSEAVNFLIPNQKLDRVIEYVKQLDSVVTSIEINLNNFQKNIRIEEGLDILEDGLVQASRATTQERRTRLANLVGRTLTSAEIKYAEAKKILNIFKELLDPEILWLIYYSETPTMGSEYHRNLVNNNPEILRKASKVMGAPEAEKNRGAIQDSYINTLIRLGLLDNDKSSSITRLGKLVVEYIKSDN